MKKIMYLMMVCFITLTFGQVKISTDAYDPVYMVHSANVTLSGADTVVTYAFKLPNKVMEVFCEASGDSAYAAISREYSLFKTQWTSDGTVGVDSVLTQKAWADTSTYSNVWQRIKIITTAANGASTIYKIKISAKKE